jgi:hypothetical protein
VIIFAKVTGHVYIYTNPTGHILKVLVSIEYVMKIREMGSDSVLDGLVMVSRGLG